LPAFSRADARDARAFDAAAPNAVFLRISLMPAMPDTPFAAADAFFGFCFHTIFLASHRAIFACRRAPPRQPPRHAMLLSAMQQPRCRAASATPLPRHFG